MAAAVEEGLRDRVAREGVDRPEADPDDVVALCVLAQRYGELQSFYLKGHVDQSLGVALDEAEAAQVASREDEEGGVVLGQDDQTAIEYIADEPQTVLAVVIVDVAVDFVLVDVLREKLADDEIDFGAFNEVYGKYFTSKPARSCVAVKQLPKDVLVEVEVIAEV